MEKKTMIIGASAKEERYSNMAVKKLTAYKHPVIALGSRKGKINDVIITTEKPQVNDINTISLYLNADNQENYHEYILSLKPKRIIFNPGAENPVLAKLAADEGIQTVEACTLVMLSTGQY